jgi:hypothetical protein
VDFARGFAPCNPIFNEGFLRTAQFIRLPFYNRVGDGTLDVPILAYKLLFRVVKPLQ